MVHSSCIRFHMEIFVWVNSQDVDAAGVLAAGRELRVGFASQLVLRPLGADLRVIWVWSLLWRTVLIGIIIFANQSDCGASGRNWQSCP